MNKQIFGFTIATKGRIAVAAVSFVVAGVAQAATISFTFGITADTSVFGIPSLATPTLPTTIVGSGTFTPFGTALYSEAGNISFAMIPSGQFVPVSILNNFTASFNTGTNTFSGTNSVIFGPPNAMGLPTFSSNLTILGGTGIFSGATGLATATGMATPPSGPPGPGQTTPVSFSGRGQITAPGLAAVPEPASVLLFGMGLAGILGLRKTAWSSRS